MLLVLSLAALGEAELLSKLLLRPLLVGESELQLVHPPEEPNVLFPLLEQLLVLGAQQIASQQFALNFQRPLGASSRLL